MLASANYIWEKNALSHLQIHCHDMAWKGYHFHLHCLHFDQKHTDWSNDRLRKHAEVPEFHLRCLEEVHPSLERGFHEILMILPTDLLPTYFSLYSIVKDMRVADGMWLVPDTSSITWVLKPAVAQAYENVVLLPAWRSLQSARITKTYSRIVSNILREQGEPKQSPHMEPRGIMMSTHGSASVSCASSFPVRWPQQNVETLYACWYLVCW